MNDFAQGDGKRDVISRSRNYQFSYKMSLKSNQYKIFARLRIGQNFRPRILCKVVIEPGLHIQC